MIYYRPTDGDPLTSSPPSRPNTCFLMTQLGDPLPARLPEIHDDISKVLTDHGYALIDAESVVTGKDFLLKIWELVVSVPLGIAVIHEDMPAKTIANIFYELGLMQAYGKETLVVKSPDALVPSDFVRTEYLEYSSGFDTKLSRFMESVYERAAYFVQMADLLENNPLLSIDYLRRAYLICGEEELKERAMEIIGSAGLEARARNSVEMLAATF
jgi:hypothetical protein